MTGDRQALSTAQFRRAGQLSTADSCLQPCLPCFYTAWCALSVIERPNVRLSVCPSSSGGWWFAAEVGRGQLDIDRQLLLTRD